MDRQKFTKLNQLMSRFPASGVLTSQWLEEQGYYRQLVEKYCKAGWLTRLGHGAFARLNDTVSWQGAVMALQQQSHVPAHLGGLSALNIYGITQYVSLNDEASIFLYNNTPKKTALPKWFQQLFKNTHYYQTRLFTSNFGVNEKIIDNWTLHASIPERAILEMLALTPNKVTLQHAMELMEGLHRLRSHHLQTLLEVCLSIKVKRLFLCLAELYHLDFFEELDLNRIALGSGKRVIGSGGKYFPKWQLSLPSDLVSQPQLEKNHSKAIIK